MINKISFGSHYRAYITKDNLEQGDYFPEELESCLDSNKVPYVHQMYDTYTDRKYVYPYDANIGTQYIPEIDDYAVSCCAFDAPDYLNFDIETILKNYGIKFKKVDSKFAAKQKEIMDRVAKPDCGDVVACVDSEKLEELVTCQDSNFQYAKDEYNKYLKDMTAVALDGKGKIYPQTLSIKYLDDDLSPEALAKYIETNGMESLDYANISINQHNYINPHTNIYYGLKDMGYVIIPFYMNMESVANAKILGIVE